MTSRLISTSVWVNLDTAIAVAVSTIHNNSMQL